MAKGLSKTQKQILDILEDYPEGIELKDLTKLIKEKLYPELYQEKPKVFDGFTIRNLKDQQSKEKRNTRVIISRSIKRLQSRDIIIRFDDYYDPGDLMPHLLPNFKIQLCKFMSRRFK